MAGGERGTTMKTHGRRHGSAVAERQFRDALSAFATGVTIITARASHGFVGFTANSFNSVSLDPPLVIWSLARHSRSLAAFEAAERYAINVLASDQVKLARRFSRPHVDRFAGVALRRDGNSAPLIEGCAAWIECCHHALHPAGDHMLFIGEVLAAAHRRAQPLLWHAGRYDVIKPRAARPRKRSSR
jgi:flavin reductase (DIM6/NTAB) family NADH-FMN oxidoreductase RutF